MDLNRELGFSQQEFFTFQEGCHKEGSPDLLGEMPTTIQFNFVRNNYYFGTSSQKSCILILIYRLDDFTAIVHCLHTSAIENKYEKMV